MGSATCSERTERSKKCNTLFISVCLMYFKILNSSYAIEVAVVSFDLRCVCVQVLNVGTR